MKTDKYAIAVYGGTILVDFSTILFIILKICGIIKWSWLWVFAPLWGSFALMLITMIAIITFWEIKDKDF